MGFAVAALDCQGRAVTLKAGNLPKNAGFTQSFDGGLNKQKGLFTWTPPLSDVEKTLRLSFKAVADTPQGPKSSPSVKTQIRVLPPALSDAANPVAEAAVAGVSITRAVWRKGIGQVDLAGRIKWAKGAGREARALAIARTVRILDAASQTQWLEAQANLAGQWKLSISLLPKGTAPPNAIQAEFRGKASPLSGVRAHD